jgi:hypothetical protein
MVKKEQKRSKSANNHPSGNNNKLLEKANLLKDKASNPWGVPVKMINIEEEMTNGRKINSDKISKNSPCDLIDPTDTTNDTAIYNNEADQEPLEPDESKEQMIMELRELVNESSYLMSSRTKVLLLFKTVAFGKAGMIKYIY